MPQRHLNLQLKEQKRAHAWHEAIQLLVRARQSRWDPDVIGYTTAIQACDRAASWTRSLELLDEMLASSTLPNLITYSNLINSSIHWRGWAGFLCLLEKVQDLGPDLQFLNASIVACSRSSAWQLALCLPEFFEERLDSFTFSATIFACAQGIQWQLALWQVSQLDEHEFLLTAASSTCATASRWQLALDLAFKAMKCEAMPSAVAVGAAIKACERGSQWTLALAALQEHPVDVTICSAAVSACEKAQHWEQAISIVEMCIQQHLQPNSLLCGAVISSCETSSNWQLALHLLTSIRKNHALERLGDTMPVAATISCCSKGRQWEVALEVLSSSNTRSCFRASPSSAMSLVCLTATIEACSLGNAWKAAKSLLDAMPKMPTEDKLAKSLATQMVSLASEQCGVRLARSAEWPRAHLNDLRAGRSDVQMDRLASRVARRLGRGLPTVLMQTAYVRHMLAVTTAAFSRGRMLYSTGVEQKPLAKLPVSQRILYYRNQIIRLGLLHASFAPPSSGGTVLKKPEPWR